MNAKGQIWQYIIGGLIALAVVIIILLIFYRGTERGYGGVEEKLSGLEDCDGDGAANMFDDCKCDEKIQSLPAGQSCPNPCTSPPVCKQKQ